MMSLYRHPAVPSAALVELRQYSLKRGRREELIELFDRELVETQEAVGMTVLGQFRDLDEADRFVWLRGFPDMPTRAAALEAFYGGPVWRKHRDAANATMIDSDNVLLLVPASDGTTIVAPERRPFASEPQYRERIIAAVICPQPECLSRFSTFFAEAVRPLLIETGATIIGEYVTSTEPNNFPRLPVREEKAFVVFCRFEHASALEAHRAALARHPRWANGVSAELLSRLAGQPELLRLTPTEQSRL
jgi:quinol monooxygenase YgiN